MVGLLKFLSVVIWVIMVTCLIFRPGARVAVRSGGLSHRFKGGARGGRAGKRAYRHECVLSPPKVPNKFGPMCPA